MLDIIGKKFNNLYVISFHHKSNDKHYRKYFKCKCDCGNYTIIRSDQLKNTISCGCEQKKCLIGNKYNYKHGLSFSKFYHTWNSMVRRCKNNKTKYYYRYGGRGITISDDWLKFINFYNDMYESYLKHTEQFGEQNTTLDRINNNDSYYKNNCRWATRIEQSNNTCRNRYITYKGQTRTLAKWARELNINYKVLHNRLNKYKLSIEKAFTK